jgi:hypothetical protein
VDLETHLDRRHNPVHIAFLLNFVGLERPAELADGLTIPGEV